jgi:hypothetical protein
MAVLMQTPVFITRQQVLYLQGGIAMTLLRPAAIQALPVQVLTGQTYIWLEIFPIV